MRAGTKEMILMRNNKINSSIALRERREVKEPILFKQNQTTKMLEKGTVLLVLRATRIDWEEGPPSLPTLQKWNLKYPKESSNLAP